MTEKKGSVNPFVSVILPCYNCEKYIAEALGSLLRQDCTDFEILCIDDGSTDDTWSQLLRFAERADTLRPEISLCLFREENRGVSGARNLGLSLARGKYILFLDADDLFEDTMISSLVNAAEKYGTDTVFCRLKSVYGGEKRKDRSAVEGRGEKRKGCDAAEGRREKRKDRGTAEGRREKRKDQVAAEGREKKNSNHLFSREEMMHMLLYGMSSLGFCTFLYRREILSEHGLLFDEKTRFFEDREFNWKYLVHTKTGSFVDRPLYIYRRTDGSATTSRDVYWNTDGCDAADRIEQYLLAHGCAIAREAGEYLRSRVLLTAAKKYAAAKRYDLFFRLSLNYDMKRAMKRNMRSPGLYARLASGMYLLSPGGFYFLIGQMDQHRHHERRANGFTS